MVAVTPDEVKGLGLVLRFFASLRMTVNIEIYTKHYFKDTLAE